MSYAVCISYLNTRFSLFELWVCKISPRLGSSSSSSSPALQQLPARFHRNIDLALIWLAGEIQILDEIISI
jgi:hypothetical protein